MRPLMPLLNIGLVTRTLVNLLTERAAAIPGLPRRRDAQRVRPRRPTG